MPVVLSKSTHVMKSWSQMPPETISNFSIRYIPRSLVQPIEVLARNNYTRNWIQNNDFLSDFDDCLSQQETPDAHLAMRESLGIFSLSVDHSAPEIFNKAIEKYTLALELLKKALKDEKEAREDRTVMGMCATTRISVTTPTNMCL